MTVFVEKSQNSTDQVKAVQKQYLANLQCGTLAHLDDVFLEVIHSELSSSLYQLLLALDMHFLAVGHDDVHLMV